MPCGRRRIRHAQKRPWLRLRAACIACALPAIGAAEGVIKDAPKCANPLYSLSCAKEFEDFATEVFQLKILLLNASYHAVTRSAAVGGWHFVLLRPLIEMADLTVVSGNDTRSDGASDLDLFGGGSRRPRHRRRRSRQRNRRLPDAAREAPGDRDLAAAAAMTAPSPARLVPQSIDAQARCQADPACCQVTGVMELAVYQQRCLGKEARPILIHVPSGQACGLAPIVDNAASVGATVAFITAGMNLDGWPFITLRGDPSAIPPGSTWDKMAKNGACAKEIVRQLAVRFWFVTQHRRDLEALYFAGEEKVRHLPLGVGETFAAGGLVEEQMLGRIRTKYDALVVALQGPTATGSGYGGKGSSSGCVAEAVEGASPAAPVFTSPSLDLLSASFSRFTEPVTHRENTSAELEHTFAPYMHVGTSAAVETDKVLGSLFVVSPRGMGADTWLHWQALSYGAIPLVDYDPILWHGARLLTNLPALPVKTWTGVNCTNLRRAAEKVLQGVRDGAFDYNKLSMEYWAGLVRETLQPEPQVGGSF